jgi:hypothetical protein
MWNGVITGDHQVAAGGDETQATVFDGERATLKIQ